MVQVERLRSDSLGIALESLTPRNITPYTIEMIKDFEGWSATAYDDPSGYCTVGYGHLIALRKCESIDLGEFSKAITKERGHRLLELDTRIARKAVEDLVDVSLNDAQFSALSSFVYNVGESNFSNSTLLLLLNQSDYSAASAEFPKWVYSKKVVLTGLVTRRGCERHKYDSNIGFDYTEPFSRENCEEVLGIAGGSEFYDIETGERQ
ncbi:MAG: lysozyme [Pseudomonadota bacterium]